MNMFSVYYLVDPREPMVVRYVGKAKNPVSRRWSHVRAARQSGAKRHRDAWVKSLLNDGVQPQMMVCQDQLTEDEAFTLEIKEIARLLELGHPLTNGTIGGDGVSGHVYTPEQLEAKRVEWRDPVIRKKRVDGIVAAWSNPETREGQVLAIRAALARESTRKRMSEGQQRLWETTGPERRMQYSEMMSARRAEMPERFDRTLWTDEKHVIWTSRISESMKTTLASPQQRRRLSRQASRLYACECGKVTTRGPLSQHQKASGCTTFRKADKQEVADYRRNKTGGEPQ